jgi:putative peptidoglycan lipid II flippase
VREGGPGVGRSFLGAGAVLALTLAAGRLSGLLREMQLAASFGVTSNGDLAVILLTLPDLLVNVLLAGGLSAALVPRLRALSPLEASSLFKSTMIGVAAFFAAAAAAIVVWPGATFAILAPGMAAVDVDLHRRALGAVALAIPLTAITGVTTAYLNAHQRFFVAGCGTLIFNLCVIGALLVADSSIAMALSLALGIALGAMLRAASQLAALPHSAWERRARPGRLDGPFVRAFMAATGAASLMLLVPIVVRALASLTGAGSIASFNYATKLVEVPVGILISAAGTVALARLSEHHARGDAAGARVLTRDSLQRTILLSLAVLGPGLLFADAAVAALLGRGQMSVEALHRVSVLTRLALIGLPFVAIVAIAAASLNAQGRSVGMLRGTLWAALALPLLALPGVLLHSERYLMLAVVAFQAVHSVLLLRVARIPTLGPAGWLGPTMLGRVALIGALTAVVGVLDRILLIESHWIRLVVATATFAVAAALPLRVWRGSPPAVESPDDR